jgi:hypothetical protein
MPLFYKEVNDVPQPVDNINQYLEDTGSRRVAFTNITSTISVSTVFLGINHNFDDGTPILYESLVQDTHEPMDNEIMVRYETRQQAIDGHDKLCEKMKMQVRVRK